MLRTLHAIVNYTDKRNSPGQQHTTWPNPFEEKQPRVAEWSAKEIATIAARLDKQLGPEYISSRAGPGGSRVHYLTAEKCITLANEVFGFNGWSSSIQNIQVDFADENAQTQRVCIGLSVIVRITLRDGTYHEDIGYGSIENARGKAMAFEKAKKEGTTDALKRTLRSFGNVLGNCIYDKDYVSQVTKIKAQPVKKFDQDNLHRHSDYAKHVEAKITALKQEQTMAPPPKPAAQVVETFDDFLGDFDEADFCVPVDGHPDEIVVSTTAAKAEPPKPAPPAARPPQTPSHATRSTTPKAQAPAAFVPEPNPGEPVAFFSARSVSAPVGNAGAAPQQQNRLLFNPKAESPSIRKTPGIDHSSSKPLSRSGAHVPPASQSGEDTPSHPDAQPGRPNPALDNARRIGAPGGGSPLSNRGSYKPPTMKRPLVGENAPNRIPLGDIPTNASVDPAGGDSLESKRQKTT